MVRVHTHTATELGLIVNIHVVETERGAVLIDGGVALSSSRAARRLIDRTVAKPLLGVLMTHGHPDHYMGIAEILNGRDVPIYALQGAADQARARDAEESDGMRQSFGPNFPERRVFPNRIVEDGAIVTLDDVAFHIRDYGPAESDSDGVWFVADGGQTVVLCGDLIYNAMHLFMKDGHAREWLAALDRLAGDFPAGEALFYPAHGARCGHEGIAWTKNYIENYLKALNRRLDGRQNLSASEETAFIGDLKTLLPSDDLIQLSAFKLDETIAKLAPVADSIVSNRG